jgi:sugar/nucleoside kinase (ribokinase family)
VVIKKGEHGALMFHEDTIFAALGYPLEQVVDPTGAGDSFAGAMMGYLAKTNDLSMPICDAPWFTAVSSPQPRYRTFR